MSIARAITPPHRRDLRPHLTAQLLSIDSVNKRASVSINGGPAVSLPYVDFGASAFTGVTTVWVAMDTDNTGAGQLVLGPAGTQAAGSIPDPPAAPAPVTKTFKTTIRPTWSGTWRDIRSLYDRWNTDRYGGRSTLWQGDAFGSGSLTGIAVYGNQIKALGADTITAITVHTPFADNSGTVQLQGTAQGTSFPGAPSPTGSTASDSSGLVSLGSTMREGFRTGSLKGLCLVGSTYLAVYGTAKASGMALSITYTKEV